MVVVMMVIVMVLPFAEKTKDSEPARGKRNALWLFQVFCQVGLGQVVVVVVVSSCCCLKLLSQVVGRVIL